MRARKAGFLGLTLAFSAAGSAAAQDSTVVQRFSDAPVTVASPAATLRARTAFGVPSFPTGGSPVVPDIATVQQSVYGGAGYGGFPGYAGGGYPYAGGGFPYAAPGVPQGYPYAGGGFPYGTPGVPQGQQWSPFGAPSTMSPSAAVPPAAFGLPQQQQGQQSNRTVFAPPRAGVVDLSPPTAPGPSAGLPAAAVSLRNGRPYTLEQVADPSSEFYGGTGLEGLDARQAELADVAQAVGLRAGHAAEAAALARALEPYEAVLDQRFGGSSIGVARAVRWRDYLVVPSPSFVPPSGVAASSRSDRIVWRRGVELGWSRGTAEARRLLAERLDALLRDHASSQSRAEADPPSVATASYRGGATSALVRARRQAGARR